jgi:hypothetical protein
MAAIGGRMGYDIIGDIHGYAETLRALLEKMGYGLEGGIYRHSKRQAIFLGDFIDRGPHQRETLKIVRPMVEHGHAMAVMGNHEFNALAYSTPRNGSVYLRPRNVDNEDQHQKFLKDFPVDSSDYLDAIEWFRTLPLWLDLGELRVVHACWDKDIISSISRRYEGSRLTDDLLRQASTKGCDEYDEIETLLKGKEIPLPEGCSYLDHGEKERRHMRIAWWDRENTTYKGKFVGDKKWKTHIPEDEIEGDHGIVYGHDEPPVFLGHYWLDGTPAPLEANVACLDYSVGNSNAEADRKLVAYRWDGERELKAGSFVQVDRIEP